MPWPKDAVDSIERGGYFTFELPDGALVIQQQDPLHGEWHEVTTIGPEDDEDKAKSRLWDEYGKLMDGGY